MQIRMSDPLTFKVVVAVQDLTQFQYKFAELLLIYSFNLFLLLEVEIHILLFKIHPTVHTMYLVHCMYTAHCTLSYLHTVHRAVYTRRHTLYILLSVH